MRLLGRRALGHAGERRPHLAGDAENENVAGNAGEVGDQLRRRLGHEVFERRDAVEAVGQALGAHAAFSGNAGAMRPFGAAGIGRMAAKSMSAATAKPGQASEPSASRPLLDAQPGGAAGPVVEVRVRAGEGRLLALRRERHAVDEMMAVALHVGQPQQRHQRQVLLHAHPRQRGEVLGRHEISLRACLGVELGDARGVEDRFVESLAVLAGDAAVAEPQRRRERGQLAVELVDDQRLQAWPAPRPSLAECLGALDRLLDEQRGRDQPRQRRRLAHAPPQLGDALDAVVLLVAVERRQVVAGVAVEHGGDLGQAAQVRRDVAADLQLVVAVP